MLVEPRQALPVGWRGVHSDAGFPEEALRKAAKKAKSIIVPEMNLGQLYHKVREAVGYNAEVVKLSKIGGIMHSPQEIVAALKE